MVRLNRFHGVAMNPFLQVIRIITIFASATQMVFPIAAKATGNADEVTIIDARHYSNVFGETRNYRVFLPPGYSENTAKRYPVIYFFHGSRFRTIADWIKTSPIYEKNQSYTVHVIDTQTQKVSHNNIEAGNEGRLTIRLTGSSHEVGINKKADKPNVSMVRYEITDRRWPSHGKNISITTTLLNKGGSSAKNARASLSATRPTTVCRKRLGTVGKTVAGCFL
jgi:hypothetical protein